jgi:hypothetical protein
MNLVKGPSRTRKCFTFVPLGDGGKVTKGENGITTVDEFRIFDSETEVRVIAKASVSGIRPIGCIAWTNSRRVIAVNQQEGLTLGDSALGRCIIC